MSEITSTLVKTLREKTGAGMMDCKKALVENQGNLETSVDWLRKKGLAAVAKKAGRVAAEGLVGLALEDHKAAVVEINTETDFVARNPEFQDFVSKVARIAVKGDFNRDQLENYSFEGSMTVADKLTSLIAVIGENIQLRRIETLSVLTGVVATYIHNALTPYLGRIGVLVALESTASKDALLDLGKKIAMHVAAAAPVALTIAEVDPTAVAREKAILEDQAKASGRPQEVIEKMVEGRIRKYYEEVVLLEQTYMIDGKTKIAEVLEQASKDLGTSVRLKGFVRFALGEGIEKEQSDFRSEVMAVQTGR